MSDKREIKAVAKVEMNNGIALVLNRMPIFKYERFENLLYANDGGFVSVYYYEKPSRSFQAFGGRKFDLHLLNGETVHCDGQWWDGGTSKLEQTLDVKLRRVAISTIEKLKGCYVYYGGSSLIEQDYQRLIEECEGPVYPYWEYEKLIKFDDLRAEYFKQKHYDRIAKQNIIAEARKYKKLLEADQ